MAAEPSALDHFMEYVEELKEHPVPYCLAGVGIGLVTFPLGLVMVFAIYGGMFVGMIPGMVLEDELVLSLGMIGVPLLAVLVVSVLFTLVTVPMQASLLLSIDAHQARDEDEELGFMSSFAHVRERAVPAIVYVLGFTFVYTMLLFLFVLPGILFAVLADMAWPLVVLEKMSPVEAVQKSVRHFMAHLPWHLGYILILFAMAFILAYIPFVGAFISPGIVVGWRVWAFRAIREELIAA
jgi:uncharacterized membrane protein